MVEGDFSRTEGIMCSRAICCCCLLEQGLLNDVSAPGGAHDSAGAGAKNPSGRR